MSTTLSHLGDIYAKIATDKNKGFIKDEYVDVSNKWMSANGARMNFRGTGHPDRPVPTSFMEVMEQLSKERVNYTPATGAPDRKSVV